MNFCYNFIMPFTLLLSCLLIFCLLRIYQLKRALSKQKQKELFSRLSLQLVSDIKKEDYGIYIENQGIYTVTDIEIGDLELWITDSGFTKKVILKFDKIDLLGEKQRLKLNHNVFDRDNNFMPHVADNIITHILNMNFELSISYTAGDNARILAKFIKKKDKFFLEKISEINKK